MLASSHLVPASLAEGEVTVFQLQITLSAISSNELRGDQEEYWLSYMVLNADVHSAKFSSPKEFKSLTDEFSLRGPLSHIKRYIQDSPALIHLFGSASGLIGTAVLPLDRAGTGGQGTQSRIEFFGGPLKSTTLTATVALLEGDNESVVSSVTSSQVSSHDMVDLPLPAPAAAAVNAADAKALIESCMKMEEDLHLKVFVFACFCLLLLRC